MTEPKANRRLFVNSQIHKMAEEVVERELRERELLIAHFILENPEVEADRIVFSTRPNKHGGLDMSVREMTEEDEPPEVTH